MGASRCTSCSEGMYSGAGAVQCNSCAAGHYCPMVVNEVLWGIGAGITTRLTEQIPCAAGTFSPAGATTCTPCAAGRFSAAGAAQCTLCSAGTYSSGPGAATCTPCSAGHYSAAGAASCTPSAPGYFTSDSITQTICPAGTTSFGGEAGADCEPCYPGDYRPPGSSSLSCMPCPAGTYSSTARATSCNKCADSEYPSSMIGGSSCVKCPTGTYNKSGDSGCRNCAPGDAGEMCVNVMHTIEVNRTGWVPGGVLFSYPISVRAGQRANMRITEADGRSLYSVHGTNIVYLRLRQDNESAPPPTTSRSAHNSENFFMPGEFFRLLPGKAYGKQWITIEYKLFVGETYRLGEFPIMTVP
jgi:hypothetical protein